MLPLSHGAFFLEVSRKQSNVAPQVLPSRVPASAGKAKAGMVHSVSGWTRGMQVKLWNHSRRVPYLSALKVCSRQIHVYLTLPYCTAALSRHNPTVKAPALSHGCCRRVPWARPSEASSSHTLSLSSLQLVSPYLLWPSYTARRR